MSDWFQQILAWISSQKLDLKTAVVTIIGAPMIVYFIGLIRVHVKTWGTYIIEGTVYWVSKYLNQSLSARFSMRRYCRLQLATQNRFLHVPSTSDVKLEIDRVFVTLSLEQGAGNSGRFTHSDIITAGNRIRVVGDPGSGKSSLVKRIYRDTCLSALRSPGRTRLPILIELRDIVIPATTKSEDAGLWLLTHLRDVVQRVDSYQMAQCFEAYIRTTGVNVLLDGLDEVSTTNYPRIQHAILQLSARLAELSENNLVILTMRAQFHQQVRDAYRSDFGPALFLKPFTPTDIYEFLTRWPFASNKEDQISRIYNDLTDRPTLREMCSNPLILAMYVAEDQSSGQVVSPESRTEFYSKVLQELIIQRRLGQTGPIIGRSRLREQREQILGRLAYDHLIDPNQPTNSIGWAEALRVTQEVIECDDRESANAFRDISKETGIVSEERNEQTFRFIHLTLCEFMAAFEAVQGRADGWARLIAVHKSFVESKEPQLQTRLLEVIPFACGLLPRVQRFGALEHVANLGDARLLARCFLETKLYDHPNWSLFASKMANDLSSTNESERDAGWLRDLHLFNVVLRDAEACATHTSTIKLDIDLETFIAGIVVQQKEGLSALLSAYASQDAAAALRVAEVCHLDLPADFPEVIIIGCDQAPFFALMLQNAFETPARTKLWCCILAESALRSRIVARWLYAAPPNVNWITDRPLSRGERYIESVIGYTLYTQCLFHIMRNSSDLPSFARVCRQFANTEFPRFSLGFWMSSYFMGGTATGLTFAWLSSNLKGLTWVGLLVVLWVAVLLIRRVTAARTNQSIMLWILNLGGYYYPDESETRRPVSVVRSPMRLVGTLLRDSRLQSRPLALLAGNVNRERKFKHEGGEASDCASSHIT